jgi:hypothetical protein
MALTIEISAKHRTFDDIEREHGLEPVMPEEFAQLFA